MAVIDTGILAQQQGVIIVASAGNESKYASTTYPAAYANVSAVGATDYYNKLAPYSN